MTNVTLTMILLDIEAQALALAVASLGKDQIRAGLSVLAQSLNSIGRTHEPNWATKICAALSWIDVGSRHRLR
jgi:hypothetical protein